MVDIPPKSRPESKTDTIHNLLLPMEVPNKDLNKASGAAGTYKPWPQVLSRRSLTGTRCPVGSRPGGRHAKQPVSQRQRPQEHRSKRGSSKTELLSKLPGYRPSCRVVARQPLPSRVRLVVAGSSWPQVAGKSISGSRDSYVPVFCPVRLAGWSRSSQDDWTIVQHSSPHPNLSSRVTAGLFVIVPAFAPYHSPVTGFPFTTPLVVGNSDSPIHGRCPRARGGDGCINNIKKLVEPGCSRLVHHAADV